MEDYVYFRFALSGKSICGDEQKPESCRDCTDLSNCAIEMFYDALSNPSELDPLDVLSAWRAYKLNQHHSYQDYDHVSKIYTEEQKLIKDLKENPYAVIIWGRKEGWLK
jgi:hypothetical protein